ncbi:MAG: asparagine synthase (glutamine-hydrolyzing) [Flavobacteriales bacterium]|nr:asparagine synthase (glutamine-hydrolyzing) [Flavobacteriales bacterium]
MCGIAGYIGKKPLAEDNIRRTLDRMKQRGPDAQRFQSFAGNNVHVSLLHSRLSIIDLDARSHQPFHCHGCTLVFNGEIYNYVELREELLRRKIPLTTSSDTEILMHYYLIYGEDCVKYFEGMWALALWDEPNQKLFLSRDRFAEKPLYYFRNDEGFFFASEVKALKSLSGQQFSVNENHLLRYIINGHKSLYKTEETFFYGVREIPFASNGIIDASLSFNTYPYWKPEFCPNENLSFEAAAQGTLHHLTESLKLRLRSDVPLAFCLSGGVDSASLVSIAAKIFNANVNTFSIIDTDHRYDELDNIQATIDDTGCASTKIVLQPGDENIARLESLIEYHDAPIATISYFVHSMLSEAISQNGFKISISGTAADEMFTGYYDHFVMHLYETRNEDGFEKHLANWKNHVLEFVRHPDFRKHDLFFDNPQRREHIYLNNAEFRSYLNEDWNEEFTETNYSSTLLRNRMMNELFHEVVRVILHEDDLNSMKYSIENRSPFLDTNLFNFAYSIPSRMLIDGGYNKFILRSAMKGILNDKVRLSREKKGFNASINSIFDFSNPVHRDYFLSDSEIFRWFNRDKIAALLQQKEFTNSYKKFLFDFVCAKIFLKQQSMN